MKKFNLAIYNHYGYIETFPISTDVTDEDIDKMVDDYVEDFKKQLKVHYLVRYEKSERFWDHKKFWKKKDALDFLKSKKEVEYESDNLNRL
jgi:hypothetical protein